MAENKNHINRHIDINPEAQWQKQAIYELNRRKLNCPFCGEKLYQDKNDWTCSNEKCMAFEIFMPLFGWQAIIDGKAAQDALNDIRAIYLENVRMDIQDKPINWFVCARAMYDAGKSITSITKQEKE